MAPRDVSQLSSLVGESFSLKMSITYHLVAKAYYDSLDPNKDYTPSDFSREGFIHCTDGAEEMAHTANRYYQSSSEPFYYLYIDKTRVHAPIRYDDSAHIYPHVYGTLNRDAIIAVRDTRRDANGNFLTPETLAF